MENRERKIKEYIQNTLLFCAEALSRCEVKTLPEEDFSLIRHRVIPSFCYDNSFMSAVTLNASVIVYGAAIIDISGQDLPVEHAWIKMRDGTYVDPTYQLLNENKQPPLDVRYYALFEVPTLKYVELAESLGNHLGDIVAMDFSWLRKSNKHKHLFSTTRKK